MKADYSNKTNPANELRNSVTRLQNLAAELSLNYFNASTVDLFPDKEAKKSSQIALLKDKVFKGSPYASDETMPYTRNILVIGAGCTFNSFSTLPLATKAQSQIQREIMVDVSANVNLDLVINYSLREILEKRGNQEDRSLLQTVNECLDSISNKQSAYLEKNYKNEKSLLKGIGDRYYSEYEKLLLHGSRQKKQHIDFETSLNLLSKLVPFDTVRNAIHTLYHHQYGPIPFYEIVAHMFKHRFIDAIINFNFDEFLNQAIEEELGRDGYDFIISDGDCRLLTDLSQGGRLRQPLYIKPHGTASHKSSLRFTKDQYYELPSDMRKLIEDLIEGEDGGVKKRINLITVGFEMNSLEFNEILRQKLPVKSNVFSFYYHDDSSENSDFHLNNVLGSRNDILENIFSGSSNQPDSILIGHEFFKSGEVSIDDGRHIKLEENFTSLGNCFGFLFDEIVNNFNSPYKPKGLTRHWLIIKLFGNKRFWRYLNLPDNQDGYPNNYFETTDYFRDRLLVEILISTALNKGRIDPPLAMSGRIGLYYSLYYKKTADKKQKPTPISEFINNLKFEDQNNGLEPLGINPLRINKVFIERKELTNEVENIVKYACSETSPFSEPFKGYLRTFDTGKLSSLLKKDALDILHSTRINIKSGFRNSIHHVFQHYEPTNLLNTGLSIDLHYYEGLVSKKANNLWIIGEYGIQLSKFLDHIVAKKLEVRLILADRKDFIKDINEKKNMVYKSLTIWAKKFSNAIPENEIRRVIPPQNIKFLPINKHNHHMALFLKLDNNPDPEKREYLNKLEGENRAIYYYQRGLSNTVDPIRIVELENISYLRSKFEDYWKSPESL